VFPRKDISISINENPRSKENFNTIGLLDIPTSSDDFDRYIESQIELNKLNANLSEADYKIEQESELKKKLIDSIVCLQCSRNNDDPIRPVSPYVSQVYKIPHNKIARTRLFSSYAVISLCHQVSTHRYNILCLVLKRPHISYCHYEPFRLLQKL
jgi:hypothetical protein